MNIHFNDKLLFDKFLRATLAQVQVGSVLYGLHDEQSDTDMLCIYFPFHNQTYSFVQTHHQLQYKDTLTRTDYLFVDVFSFVRNALSGDSTLNFEALHCESLLQTPLHFLYASRSCFYNYPVIKSYLGFAQRDLKQYWQQPTERDAIKKYIHAERGYAFAQQMLAGSLTLQSPVLLEKKVLFSGLLPAERKRVLHQLQADVDTFRKTKANAALEAGHLTRYMQPDHQKQLDQNLYSLRQTPQFQMACTETMAMELFYEVNENGILYDQPNVTFKKN
jgi:predicted nucleotidyltransferase